VLGRAARARLEKGFAMRLLDQRFRYIPAANTDVAATWRRFGFRPTTESERRARQRADAAAALDAAGNARGDIELAPQIAATVRAQRCAPNPA
jgi:hypothetical protein